MWNIHNVNYRIYIVNIAYKKYKTWNNATFHTPYHSTMRKISFLALCTDVVYVGAPRGWGYRPVRFLALCSLFLHAR